MSFNRGRVTLRLQYWHQSPVGESSQHQALLYNFMREYLEILRRQEGGSYPWNSQIVRLNGGTNQPRSVVAVQVNLVHRHYTADSPEASSQCRDLWNRIKNLTSNAEFRHLFDSPLIAINIRSVNLADPHGADYKFGMVVQNLGIEVHDIVHVAENPLEFLGRSVVLAAEVIALIGWYATRARQGPTASVQRSAHDELRRVVQMSEEVGNTMQRTWNLYRDSNVSDEVAVRKISEATVKARRLFDQSYVGAVSRVDKVCNNDNPTGEQVMEAIIAVRKMTLLNKGVADGSRNMVACLKSRKTSTNTKIAAVAMVDGVAALYTAAFFFGPAGWAAASIFSWVAAAGAGGTTALAVGGTVGGVVSVCSTGVVGTKVLLEGARFEKIEQGRQDILKVMTKLQFYLAAIWLEHIWKMKFADIPDREREIYLGSLGVDPMFFGVKEYKLAQLRDSLAEFKVKHAEMAGHFKGLYKDLKVSTEVEYREPTPA